METRQRNDGTVSGKSEVSFPLPAGVHFEVPHDYARFCAGHPVRVASTRVSDDDVLVTWTADVLRFASGLVVVEFDLPCVRGFLVNLAEPLTGMTASTLRICFADPTSSRRAKLPDGTIGSIPIFSANPAYAGSVREIADILSRSRVPVHMFASLADLTSNR